MGRGVIGGLVVGLAVGAYGGMLAQGYATRLVEAEAKARALESENRSLRAVKVEAKTEEPKAAHRAVKIQRDE